MRSTQTLTIFLVALALTPAVLAAADPAATDTADPAATDTGAVFDARSGFAKLKSLAGEWHGRAGTGEEAFDARVTWQVTAAGHAVVESLFPGSVLEMKTVYHLEGERLVLTHYCAEGNQPRMALVPGNEAGVLAFQFDGGANIVPERDPHMHESNIRFLPDGSLESRWQFYAGGQPQYVARFDLSRGDLRGDK